MAKGSGGSAIKGSGGVGGAGTNANQKANTKLASPGLLNGKAIQGLIAAKGGLVKSVNQVTLNSGNNSKSNFKGLSKSQILAKSQYISSVKIRISHAYRNEQSGGGLSFDLISGESDVVDAKNNGATHIYATVTQVGKRGKITTWKGNVKL